jgi:inhibitor of cysteine peptidase
MWPSEVQARVGQPVMFRLPGTAGTGYTWQLASGICPFLPLAFSQQLESSKDGRVGGPSEWVFTFTAEAPGTCAIAFIYHRPWERDVAPAETRTVTVTVVAP